jgi:hypothetical protein
MSQPIDDLRAEANEMEPQATIERHPGLHGAAGWYLPPTVGVPTAVVSEGLH